MLKGLHAGVNVNVLPPTCPIFCLSFYMTSSAEDDGASMTSSRFPALQRGPSSIISVINSLLNNYTMTTPTPTHAQFSKNDAITWKFSFNTSTFSPMPCHDRERVES